jgi:hypothetical protein
MGYIRASKTHLSSALQIARQLADPNEEALVGKHMMELYLGSGELETAERVGLATERLAAACEDYSLLPGVLRLLWTLLKNFPRRRVIRKDSKRAIWYAISMRKA